MQIPIPVSGNDRNNHANGNDQYEEQDSNNHDGEDMNCLYAILNVPSTASSAAINAAYKQLSRAFHPDKSTITDSHGSQHEQGTAHQSFVIIKQAHDILSDPVLRRAYDIGGPLAVDLVKRSQVQATAARQRRKPNRFVVRHDDDRNNKENDDDDTVLLDLYTLLQEASSDQDATDVIHDAVEEYLFHQQELQRHRYQQIYLSSIMPWTMGTIQRGWRRQAFLQRDTLSLQCQWRRRIHPKWNLALGAHSLVLKTKAADIRPTISLNYQPSRGTDWFFETTHRFSETNEDGNNKQPLEASLFRNQIYSLRTARLLSNSTVIVSSLGGNLQSANSWTYTLSTYRNILVDSLFPSWNIYSNRSSALENNRNVTNQRNTTIQASWKIGIKPSSGQLPDIVAGLKSLSFPQWKCRCSLSSLYPFKISYQPAEVNSVYLAFSSAFYWSRIKLLWVSHWNGQTIKSILGYKGVDPSLTSASSWTIKYGIKYNGHALHSGAAKGAAVWTILCHVQSSSWSFHMPISILRPNAAIAPVTWIVTIIMMQWFDQELEPYIASVTSTLHRNEHRVTVIETQQDFHHTWNGPITWPYMSGNTTNPWSNRKVIWQVAAIKRRIESARDGLVIRQAKWEQAKTDPSSAQIGTRVSVRRREVTITRDVTDLMQFWVVDGQLDLPPIQGAAQQYDTENETNDYIVPMDHWWRKLLRLLNVVAIPAKIMSRRYKKHASSAEPFDNETKNIVRVRYQYWHYVYEIQFSGIDDIVLPNTRALELGLADRVH